MTNALNRVFKLILGWALVLLGVIGWFLLILPGTLFIVLGRGLLSAQSEWVKKKVESLVDRFPRHAARIQGLKESLISKIRGEGSL